MKDISWAYARIKESLAYEYCRNEAAALNQCAQMNALAKRLALPEQWQVNNIEGRYWTELVPTQSGPRTLGTIPDC